MIRLFLLSLTLVCLSGCGTHRGYDWGGYENDLYRYYDNPQTAADFMVSLQEHITRLETLGKIPPPGLYAELGTLYLEAGDSAQAIAYYEKEREAWPESQHLMNALIVNLSKENRQE